MNHPTTWTKTMVTCHVCKRQAFFQEDLPNPRFFCGRPCQLIAGKGKRERSEEEEEEDWEEEGDMFSLTVELWEKVQTPELELPAERILDRILLRLVREGLIEPDSEIDPDDYPFVPLFPDSMGEASDFEFWNAQGEYVTRLKDLLNREGSEASSQDEDFVKHQMGKLFPYQPEINPIAYTKFSRERFMATNGMEDNKAVLLRGFKKHLKDLLWQQGLDDKKDADKIASFIDTHDVSKSEEYAQLRRLWEDAP